MVDTGASALTINSALSGLKFFFNVTLGHDELMVKVQPVPHPPFEPSAALCAR
jgi:integrase/recombinase XerD